MITVRKSHQRGRASFGWLNSQHTFSFGHYYDPQQMCHSVLRVINDDHVVPGAGFDTHGHRDMEIISLVLQGTIAHKDSEGNVKELPAGEFQLMSAGSGITHSEFNASKTEDLKFLQIWIVPDEKGGQPGYQQKPFKAEQGLTQVITPDGRNGTLKIKQQAAVSQLILAPGSEVVFTPEFGQRQYIHQIEGKLSVADQTLTPGDGARLEGNEAITLANYREEPVRALVFDMP